MAASAQVTRIILTDSREERYRYSPHCSGLGNWLLLPVEFSHLFPNLEEVAFVNYELSYTDRVGQTLENVHRILLENVKLWEPRHGTDLLPYEYEALRILIPYFTFTPERNFKEQLYQAFDRFALPLRHIMSQQEKIPAFAIDVILER